MSAYHVHDYMKEFNLQVQIYLKCKTQEVENLLCRKLNLISATEDYDVFNADHPITWNFYYNLYLLISGVDTNSQLFSAAIKIIKKAINIETARNVISSNFNYVAILTNHLKSQLTLEKKVMLLFLMKDLTYGIQLKWEHPFLNDLVGICLDYVSSDSENENVSILALTIIINLCYKNMSATFVLLRKISSVLSFTTKIKKFPLLSSKMIIILSEYDFNLKSQDYRDFLKLIFIDIGKSLSSNDTSLLQQSIHFIKDLKNGGILINSSVIDKKQFDADIAKILQIMKKMENSCNENVSCQSLILEFCILILDFDDSIKKLYSDMLAFTVNILMNDKYVEKCFNLIEHIAKRVVHDERYVEILDPIESMLRISFISNDSKNISIEQQIGLLKILSILVTNSRLKYEILSTANIEYFSKILSNLISTNQENVKFINIPKVEVTMYVYALNTMVQFSKIEPVHWLSGILNLFHKPQIHYVFARGLLSEQTDLIEIMLNLTTMTEFPRKEVAKIMSDLGVKIEQSTANLPRNNIKQNTMDNYFLHGSAIETRLDNMLANFSEIVNKENVKNVDLTEVINLYQNKISMQQCTSEFQKNNLDLASEELTNLKYRIGFLEAEMNSFQKSNFSLHLSKEKLKLEMEIMQNALTSHKAGYHKLQMLTDQQREKYESILTKKDAEYKEKYEAFETKCNLLESNNQALRAELKDFRENLSKNDMEIKHLKQINQKSAKELMEIKIERTNLLKEIAEKTQTIESLDREIKEIEAMRETVMSLMQSRKQNKR